MTMKPALAGNKGVTGVTQISGYPKTRETRVYLEKWWPLEGTEIAAKIASKYTAVESNDVSPQEEHGKQWKK